MALNQNSTEDFFSLEPFGNLNDIILGPNGDLPIIIMEDSEGPLPDPVDIPIVVPALGPPDRSHCETHYNFTVEINSTNTHKRKYLYSYKLNRIYVDMDCDFSVQFNWSSPELQMYVRATVVFLDQAQAEKRVERCVQHMHQGSNNGVDRNILLNVLHSSREQSSGDVEYCGDADAPDSWLSTRVALRKPGPGPVAHAYKFVCKSSCSSGINRRALAIIYTLEDAHGCVWGRHIVGARVCACPRRDMQKDEGSETSFKSNKKRVSTPTLHRTKKIKIEVVDAVNDGANERVLTLPPLEIVGERAFTTGLEVMLSMMQQAREQNPLQADQYEQRIAALTQAIQDVKNPPH